jgi:hypothetical protein
MKRMCKATALALAVLVGGGAARAVDPKLVEKAVERGLPVLRKVPFNGTGSIDVGGTALIGLTLLECDQPADDATVQAAADMVRKNVPALNGVYGLSLAILFLDRLGDPADETLIEVMVCRLLAGQWLNGAWSYNCPILGGPDEEKLLKVDRGKGARDKDKDRDRPAKRSPEDLSKPAQNLLERIVKGDYQATESNGLPDHSNTQFATLALWVGRRHGLPVDKSLERIAAHYRATQNADGGW